MKIRRPFLVFHVTISVLLLAAVLFIQSAPFANMVKSFAVKHLPSDLGVDADFSEFSIKLFPPGLSVENPSVRFQESNVADLPGGAVIRAQRIDLEFLPFQMLSGNIRVHRVGVVRGDVNIRFDQAFLTRRKSGKAGLKIRWDELLKVRADALSLSQTDVTVAFESERGGEDFTAHLLAESLQIIKSEDPEGPGYDLALDLRDVEAELPREWKIPLALDEIRARARLSANGFRIEELAAFKGEAHLISSGKVSGNILDPESLIAEANVVISANLKQLMPELSKQYSADGDIRFKGKVKGDLLRPEGTLGFDGTLVATQTRFMEWRADELVAQGSYGLSRTGGELRLEKAVISAKVEPRRGAFRPGHGGRIRLEGLRWRVGSREPLTVAAHLEDAHLHWLAAPAVDALYPLDLRVSGPLKATFLPGTGSKPWSVTTDIRLGVKSLLLDNQKYRLQGEVHRILKVKNILLEGGVIVDAHGVRPDKLALSLARTRGQVTGVVDFEKGFDLRVDAASANLEDVEEIAENRITGSGALAAHIHGPMNAVAIDFDGDLADTSYLNMKFGDLNGRISWEGGPEALAFRKVKLKKGRTSYDLDGAIQLKDRKTIAIDAQFSSAEIQDVLGIFEDLTADLWWFPKGVYGPVKGKVRIGGGLGLDELEVNGELTGRDWTYLGEEFARTRITGGYDRGRYLLDSVEATKRRGTLKGKISFDSREDNVDWSVSSDGIALSEIDQLARLDVPFRGLMSLKSEGRGRLGAIESRTRLIVSDVAVRGSPLPPSELLLTSSNAVLQVKGSALGGQGMIDAEWNTRPGASGFIKAQLKKFDFSPALLLLNPRGIQDRSLAGYISGAIDISFPSDNPDLGTGKLELTDYILSRSGTRFELVKPVSVSVERGSFRMQELAIRGRQSQASVSLSSRGGKLSGELGGEIDLSIIEFLTPVIETASGVVKLEGDISGSLKAPQVYGKATLAGSRLKVQSLEAPFENLTGELELNQNVIRATNLEAELATGRVNGGGTVTLFADRLPKLALSGTLAGSRLKFYPLQYARLRGRIDVQGEQLPYEVGGQLIVESALIREKVSGAGQMQGLRSARYMPSAGARRGGAYPLFKLNIDVKAPDGIEVKNDLFDLQLRADLKVVNTLETPRILGTADLIQGRLLFKDRVFQIQSAHAEFDNPTVINPKFNLVAVSDIGGVKVQLIAGGRVDKPTIDLTSNPPLDQSEILQLLALGLSPEELQRLRSSDRAGYDQGQAASLLLDTLDFNREVQSKTGFQIQLDEATEAQDGISVFNNRTETEPVSSPKIVIKRRIFKRLDLSVGSTVGVGAKDQKEVNAELRVTPGMSVIGVWDTTNSTGAETDQQQRESYGVDLKFQKRFK